MFPTEGRHLACIRINGELMQQMFFTAGRPDKWYQVQEGIPPDAKFVRWYISEEMNELRMVYEHESFPLVRPGIQIPFLREPMLAGCTITIEEVEEAHQRRMLKMLKDSEPAIQSMAEHTRRIADAIGKVDECHVVTGGK